jgi:ABC-type multidrug transport system ATPase subunit
VGDLAADGTGVVVASHELPAVETHADTVHVLDEGTFAASGSPAELLAETGADSLSAAFLRIVRARAGEPTVRAGVGGASVVSESSTDGSGADVDEPGTEVDESETDAGEAEVTVDE